MRTAAKTILLATLVTLVASFVLACPNGASTTTNASAVEKPRMAAAFSPGQVGPFVIPASWKQATWFIDNANSSGCASDNNRTCSSSSCTSGDGPCLTYGSIATRWGTYSPIIAQATTITVMSNDVASDVWYVDPRIQLESPVVSYLQILCPLNSGNQVWSTTLTSAVNKNQATPQLPTMTVTAATALNQLLVNTTHASRSWVTKFVSGTTWDIAQPLTGCATASACSPAENNSWGADTVTAYAPYQITVQEALPTVAEGAISVGLSPSVFFNGCQIQSQGSTSFGAFVANQYVTIADSAITATLMDNQQGAGGPTAPVLVNTAMIGRYRGTGSSIKGGYMGQGGGGFTVLLNAILQDDVEIFNTTFWTGSSILTPEGTPEVIAAYVDSGATLSVQSGYLSIGTGSAGSALWGPGAFSCEAGAFCFYKTSAAVSLLLTGTIQLGGSSTACSHSGAAPDVVDCGITVTAAHLDAAQGAAGFGGYAYQPGGGVLTSIAQ